MSVTLQILNQFNASAPHATDYFGAHYSDAEIWLYFLNTSGQVTYTDASSNTVKTVADASALQLSTVKQGTFLLDTGENSTKVFAGLGASNPFNGTNGPGVFDQDVPYALAEWTIQGNEFDNIDVSYIDSFSFPTTVTVKDAGDNITGQASFKASTKASDIITTFTGKMSAQPSGPKNDNYPKPGQVGYGPEVPTINGNTAANRWIGSSKYYISGPDANQLRSIYLYAPSFNAYLGHLQSNEPTTKTNAGNIKGWYIDYSGNNGYSGYLRITGDAASGYGLQVHHLRVNTTPSAANDWQADPNAGAATQGIITVVANGATVAFVPSDGSNVVGPWTDAVIYSGAAVIGTIGGGPIVIGTDDFVVNGAHSDIVATFLASISASLATGLLGSQAYVTAYDSATNPKATMYWFNTLTRAQALTTLFGNAWPKGEKYYDPFWASLAAYTDNQGYLSPFNDRWLNFSPDFTLGSGYSITWELGIPVTTSFHITS